MDEKTEEALMFWLKLIANTLNEREGKPHIK
jgi:hypothetical protein